MPFLPNPPITGSFVDLEERPAFNGFLTLVDFIGSGSMDRHMTIKRPSNDHQMTIMSFEVVSCSTQDVVDCSGLALARS
jgi:hypothetical protein